MKRLSLILFLYFISILNVSSQNLFLEECFVGGVTAAGRTSYSFIDGDFKIKWDESYQLQDVYVLTYRYGHPRSTPFAANGTEFSWDSNSQIGLEVLGDQNTGYFAVHAQNITNQIVIESEYLDVTMSGMDATSDIIAQGWWSLQFVILYTSPSITDTSCVRIYTASQKQTELQSYNFQKPNFQANTDVGFSIYSDRITSYYEDRTCIGINTDILGCIWGEDATNFGAGGVRGHFYYENGQLFGLDDDTANTQVNRSDGIAVINDYFTDQQEQSLFLNPVNVDISGYNPHPAFFIVYTPNCSLPQGDMPRSYAFCKQQSPIRGQPDIPDTVQFSAIADYNHYAWSTSSGLSDSTIANPLCFADSSQWFRVRMWNDDSTAACAQTIPVFLTVGKVPRPNNLQVKQSICPANTGKITFGGMAGKAPFYYTVNGYTQGVKTFDDLAPGIYDISTIDALGCVWDSTVVIPLNPSQTAAFTANPDSGYSPLKVRFKNESTLATSYGWFIDGVPFSSSENASYTFADSGTYTIALIAYRLDNTCADTAYATIRVEQGLKLIVPNVITPNGDGRNDALVAQTAGVAYMRWTVHNRWGNELHSGETQNPENDVTLWNLENNGFPDGVYTVILKVQGESGEMRDVIVQVSLIGR